MGLFKDKSSNRLLQIGLNLWLVICLILAIVFFASYIQSQSLYPENIIRSEGKLLYKNKNNNLDNVQYVINTKTNEKINIESKYLVSEPDTIENYSELNGFLNNQKKLKSALDNGNIIVGVKSADGTNGEMPIQVTRHSIKDWPIDFYLSLISGCLCVLIAGWVWALKPKEIAQQMLAISAFGILLASSSASIYIARPLALNYELMRTLMFANHFGAYLFGFAAISLFLSFPKILINKIWIISIVLLTIPLSVADYLWLLGSPSSNYIINFIQTIVIFAAIIIQWIKVRKSPRDLAALLWLGLSIVIGISIWLATIIVYASHNSMHAMPEAYAFFSFVLIYIGLGLGVSRFGLFEIGDWAFRLFFYAMAALLFVLLDSILIMSLGFADNWALTISIIIVAFGYLPLREFLWRKFLGRRIMNQNEVFNSVLDIVFAVNSHQKNDKYQGFLKQLFDPMKIMPLDAEVSRAMIIDDGMQLLLPPVLGSQSLALVSPHNGRSLFSPTQLKLIEQVITLIKTASQSRDAYESGAREERKRIAQDLHDDVGSRLLTALSLVDEPIKPTIHEALRDIRSIAHEMIGDLTPLENIMADIRYECARRLEAAKIELDWPLWSQDLGNIRIDSRTLKSISSIMREIISNLIKHSEATNFKVSFEMSNNCLNFTISDNGKGFDLDTAKQNNDGQGMNGLKKRIVALGGNIRFYNENGANIEFSVPINDV